MQNKSLKIFELNVLSKNQLKRITEDETINNDAVYLTPDCSVEYTEQNLTDTQKAQARANIGVPDINVTPDSIIGFDGEGKSVNWDISYGDGEDIIPDAIVQRTGQDIKVPDHFDGSENFENVEAVIDLLDNFSTIALSGLDVAITSSVIYEDLHSSIMQCYSDMEGVASSVISNTLPSDYSVLFGTDESGSLTGISYTASTMSCTIPIRNDNYTFEVGNVGIIGYSQGFSSALSTAYYEGKGNYPITVSDLETVLSCCGKINLDKMGDAFSYTHPNISVSDGALGYVLLAQSSDLSYCDFAAYSVTADILSTSEITVVARDSSGHVKVNLRPDSDQDATSKYYVDRLQKKVSNRDLTSESGTFDLKINYWEPLYPYGNTTECMGARIAVSLPAELVGKTISVSVANDSLSSVYQTSSGCEEILTFVTSSNGNQVESTMASNYSNSWTTQTVQHEITSTNAYIYLYIGDTIPESELSNYTYKYSTYLQLAYSYLEYTENGTPIHDTYLHSDTEVHIKTPITSLTIQDLVRCYPENWAQEWSISFKTDSSIPNITIPNNANFVVRNAELEVDYDSNSSFIQYKEVCSYYTEELPIKWLYAEPVFEANKKYLITFKQIIDTIYGVWTVLE